MGPTRGERIFKPLSRILKPFAPSSRLHLAAYRGARLFIDTLVSGNDERAAGQQRNALQRIVGQSPLRASVRREEIVVTVPRRGRAMVYALAVLTTPIMHALSFPRASL